MRVLAPKRGRWLMDDLLKPGVQVVVVNPKTGGNGRMAYLAAWGYVRSKGGTEAQAAEFVGKLYKNVPVLARGGRDATGIFSFCTPTKAKTSPPSTTYVHATKPS